MASLNQVLQDILSERQTALSTPRFVVNSAGNLVPNSKLKSSAAANISPQEMIQQMRVEAATPAVSTSAGQSGSTLQGKANVGSSSSTTAQQNAFPSYTKALDTPDSFNTLLTAIRRALLQDDTARSESTRSQGIYRPDTGTVWDKLGDFTSQASMGNTARAGNAAGIPRKKKDNAIPTTPTTPSISDISTVPDISDPFYDTDAGLNSLFGARDTAAGASGDSPDLTGVGNQGMDDETYLEKTANQVVLGNYTDDVTALGTAVQIAMGLTGADLPADIRDLTYDLTNWEWSLGHIGQTLLDAVGLIPVIGSVKYADEVLALLKQADKLTGGGKQFDNAADLARNAKEAKAIKQQADNLLAKGQKKADSAGKIGKAEGTGNVGKSKINDIIRDGGQLEEGKLKPNVTYQTGEHDYIYKTNEEGLITNATTDSLQLKTHGGRLNHNPNTYGKVKNDQAGHLFGDRFGGSPELDNLVSQAKRVNQSEFKVLENQWANALRNENQVAVDITINYATGSIRPISFDVAYTIDGVPFFSSISN